MLKLSQFDYELPEHLIAQEPLEKRDHSRLMVVDIKKEAISHYRFDDLPSLLERTDMLVMNNTKVIKARLFAKRETGATIEFFLLHPYDSKTWLTLIKGSKRLHDGEVFLFGPETKCEILKKEEKPGKHLVRFLTDLPMEEVLKRYGNTPLPPYISAAHPSFADQYEERYQTVLASQPGAVAAPTAGLHFTPELLEKLKQKEIETHQVTLHVGAGTFQPITSEVIEEHHMHEEHYHLSTETAQSLRVGRSDGKKIVAVGTTVTRTLESAFTEKGFVSGWNTTDIFIYPGVPFKCVDKLITNFHLPKSSLLLLVSAFAGEALIRHAYEVAIKENYRFYSFGDAMLLRP